MENYAENSELYHHGILGMKWGVRRYQNPDGSLTELGREHYGVGERAKKAAKKVSEGVTEYRKKRAVKTGRNLGVLSDEELDKALARSNKEVIYKRNVDTLSAKKIGKGRQIISDVLERTARNALYKASDKLVGKMFNDSDEEEIKELDLEARLREARDKKADYESSRELKKLQNEASLREARDKASDSEVNRRIKLNELKKSEIASEISKKDLEREVRKYDSVEKKKEVLDKFADSIVADRLSQYTWATSDDERKDILTALRDDLAKVSGARASLGFPSEKNRKGG